MKTIEKNILSIDNGIIIQSCNCCGPMGGLAGAIKKKWPIVEEQYLDLLKTKLKEHNFLFLGDVQLIEVEEDKIFVCNLFGQLNISASERQTEYCALYKGLEKTKQDYAFFFNTREIYFPYLWGCGLGGGDWNIVSEIIEYFYPDATICKLP